MSEAACRDPSGSVFMCLGSCLCLACGAHWPLHVSLEGGDRSARVGEAPLLAVGLVSLPVTLHQTGLWRETSLTLLPLWGVLAAPSLKQLFPSVPFPKEACVGPVGVPFLAFLELPALVPTWAGLQVRLLHFPDRRKSLMKRRKRKSLKESWRMRKRRWTRKMKMSLRRRKRRR